MTDRPANPRRKKLLVLTSTFPRWQGDTEPPFVFELCRRLSQNFDVWVLAPHAAGAKTQENLDGMTVVRFRYFFEWGESLCYRGGIMANLRVNRLRYLLIPAFLVSQLAALLRLMIQQKFDVIHAHWLIPQGLIAALATHAVRRAPALLCTAHGSDLYGLRGKWLSMLKRWVIHRADGLTMVSPSMKEHAVRLSTDADKAAVISMGIDTVTVFRPATHPVRSDNKLLFVGRLTSQKGLELLLRALPHITHQHPDITLTIIGQGPEEPFFQALSQSLGIEKNVRFLGAMTNGSLPDYYRKAAVTVFPSNAAEGFGLVCAEALACECPVIASDTATAREIIQDGETGLLFRQGDSQDLAAKILALLADPALRENMGKSGRQFVSQRFDWEIIAHRYRTLLHELGEANNDAGKCHV